MKRSALFIPLVFGIFILSCCTGKPGFACNRNANTEIVCDSTENGLESDSLIRLFLQDSICAILSSPDYVVVKHVLQKSHTDSLSKDTLWYNSEDSVGLLGKKQIGFLQYLLLSDSTWNWSKIKIKHAFEPELVCKFVNAKGSVSVVFSPASQEFGFGYTNILIRKEYKSNRLIDQFINKVNKMKKKEPKKGTKMKKKEPKKVVKK